MSIVKFSFSPTGLEVQRWVYNEETEEGNDVFSLCTTRDQIFQSFYYPCEIQPNTKLIDILNTLIPIFNELDQMFHCRLQQHLDDYNNTRDMSPSCVNPEKSHLEVYSTLTFNQATKDDDTTAAVVMELYPGFHLIEEGAEFPYSIELSPLYEYANLCVKLQDTLDVYVEDNIEKYQYSKLFDSKIQYKVWDIIAAIVWNLGFYGNPKQKQDIAESLNECNNNEE